MRVGPTAPKALNPFPKGSLSMVALFTERVEAVSSAQQSSLKHGILWTSIFFSSAALRIRLSEIREGDASMHCLSEVVALVERVYRNICICIYIFFFSS